MNKLVPFFFFALVSGFYLNVSPISSQEETGTFQYIDQPIEIDGILDEKCWALEKRPFYTKENERNDHVPGFQFLQDKDNVYFGSEYRLPDDINSAELKKGDIYFQITIVSADADKKTYSFDAEPIDRDGNLSGVVTKHCSKAANISEDFKFSSTVHDGVWVFEFLQPISELILKNKKTIKYNLKFKNSFKGEIERSYYPRRHELIITQIR